jgi:hypothetical protein
VRRTKNRNDAREMALNAGLRWGCSALDGYYYIGTLEQLKGVGAPPEPSEQ